MARASKPWVKFASCEAILWSARNVKSRLSLPKDKMMVMMQVTDQMWVGKCNNKGVTQIIAISYTFLQTSGLEVALWRFCYPLRTSEHRHQVKIHKSQVPPKTTFANTWGCVGRQQTWDLKAETRCTWQSSAGGDGTSQRDARKALPVS